MITRTTCRVCEGPLEDVFSLGEQYVSNFLDPSEPDGVKAPLDLVLCKRCTLLQLRHTVPPNAMYANYWYRSGTNKTMRDALADIVDTIEKAGYISRGETVLDIGCNDGTLLSSYKTKNVFKIGFDPAQNLSQFSKKVADRVITDFFTAENFDLYSGSIKRRPKIVTSIAMFYDLEDPNKFVSDVKKVMHPLGVWVIQMSYLPVMLKQHDFGNICHEHLEYYSLRSLQYLLNLHEMVISDVQVNDVNGGSFRIFIRNKECRFSVSKRVGQMHINENLSGVDKVITYQEFNTKIVRIKKDVSQFIGEQTRNGKSVGVYGASTKGNVMLQFFGLDQEKICFASERNPDKWGKVTVGTRIPIISEEGARERKPDYFLVLPWHFIDEFVSREKEYLEGGGRFIVPLPHFTLI